MARVTTEEVSYTDGETLMGIFVRADGNRFYTSSYGVFLHLPCPAGPGTLTLSVAGNQAVGFEDGNACHQARFCWPDGITVERDGFIVVSDVGNHALRVVCPAAMASVDTLAGSGQPGFEDGQGNAARFSSPTDVVLTSQGELAVSDKGNHAIRLVCPYSSVLQQQLGTGPGPRPLSGGGVRTLAGNGQAGFVDGVGRAARFREPIGLGLLPNGDLVVADSGNHAIRVVTMEGVVSTVAGNGEPGFADGAGAVARFNQPEDVVVDRDGTVVVADTQNHRLRKISQGQVTTLLGSSEAGDSDGAGSTARFNRPARVSLDERGRLLVRERQRCDIRVVEASLAPPLWMGPVEEAAKAPQHEEAKAAMKAAALMDFGKLLEDPELADVVVVVEGQRFPAHRNVLAVRSEYFRGLLLWGMQEGASREEVGAREIELEEVSARAFRVLLRFLYTAELPGGTDDTGGSVQENSGNVGCGRKDAESEREMECEVLQAADRFQVAGLLEHCLASFGARLTAQTAVEALIWAHASGPEEAQRIATAYVVENLATIKQEAAGAQALLETLPGDVLASLVMQLA